MSDAKRTPLGEPLLPGERLQATLRPHPVSHGAWYMPGLVLAGWALILAAVAGSASWTGHVAAGGWRFWTYLWGTGLALHLWWWLGVAALVAPLWWPTRWLAACTAGTGAIVGSVAVAFGPWGLLAAASVAGASLAWAERERRRRATILTDLRVVSRREGAVLKFHLTAVRELDWSQSLPGRLFRYGRAQWVLEDDRRPRASGLYPIGPVKELLAALVEGSDTTPFLAHERRIPERRQAALARLK